MPSIDDLDSAGRRAAQRAVPQPPPIETLATEVAARRTRKRRVIGSSIAGLALVIGVPVAASQIGGDDSPPSLLTAAQDGELDSGVAEELPSTTAEPPTEETVPPAEEPAEDAGPKSGFGFFHGGDHDFSIELGDLSFSIRTIEGDEAAEAAATAEENADETRDIDGVTVWIDDLGNDETTVSALVEPDVFVEVTGPTESIDSLLDLATREWPKVEFGPLPDLEQLFPEGEFPPFDFEEMFPEGELPPLLDLEEFFANPDGRLPEGFGLPPLEELLPPELLEELEKLENGEGWGTFDFGDPEDLPDLDSLIPPELRERLESGEPWGFFDGNDLDGLFEGTPFEDFHGCLDITIEETESGVSIQIPDCELFDAPQNLPDIDAEETSVSA